MAVTLESSAMTRYEILPRATDSNAAPQRQVYVLPASMRHGTQPSYWTETWRQKEMLADLDILASKVYQTDDIEDLIRDLDEAVDGAQAD